MAALARSDTQTSIRGNNVSIGALGAAVDSSRRTEKGLLSKKTTTETSESLKNIGSTILSGGNLNIKTGGDATFAGTTVNVGGNAEISAGKDVNIISVVDSQSGFYSSSTSKLLGSSLSENKNLNLTNQKTDMSIAGDLKITSGNNINIIGGDINASNGDINASNGDINAGNQFNLFSVQDYDYDYKYSEKTGIDLGALGLQTLATVATGAVGFFLYPPALVTTAASGIRMVELISSDHRRDGKEYEAENIIQVKSELNFGNRFDSYSENNTLIMSSNIIAKNPDSKIETGDNGDIVIADLADITKYKKTTAEYSPLIGFAVKAGSALPNAWDKESGDW